MLVQELILKKRNNYELTEEEIFWFINAVCDGSIDHSQIAAFLMSVWFNKMTEREKVVLTQAMMSLQRYQLLLSCLQQGQEIP